ncbi:LPS-assembly protein LptD [Rubrimonas cliftonensis]|uniref:LPS-assembly protein LptD n=1 Tax=Rubrimonas cliftonensis TaxID=89524 RepID=A0A1H3VZY6_9RHOB|nr:LPS assembly protein LptD [Rubrimonas cliftonensis]SDZ80366.1 LPS-assembly protein [Rubrimonas cliftonensis]
MTSSATRSTAARAALSVALAAALAPAGAPAQDREASLDEMIGVAATDRDTPAALVADIVRYDENAGTLTADGDVVVYYGERTLRAASITYNTRTGAIAAKGPIALQDGSGTTLLADAASLDDDLRDGVASGARAVLADGAGLLAAVQGTRIDGRYTALSRAVYSSCTVCAASPTPLWAIRAEQVVHDAETRDIYYRDVVFEALGVPVAWLPSFRHPDPGVERRSGVLAPTFLQSSSYGLAIKLPYFVTLGPNADATLTAFPTENDGGILEVEHRRRYASGGFDLNGSFGYLDIGEGEGPEMRGHLFGSGRFDLPHDALPSGTVAGFELATTTDDDYLRRYDFSDEDRLTSEAYVANWGDEDYFHLAAVYVDSLRVNERDSAIPQPLPEFDARLAADDPFLGGALGFTASGVALRRGEGRDVNRLSLGADWNRETIVEGGVALRGFASIRGDLYQTSDDPDFDSDPTLRVAPLVGAEARLPFISFTGDVTQIIEPVAQIVLAPQNFGDDNIPNEDSLLVEFDETNLFEIDRFPGHDRVESGARLNLGVNYALVGPAGLDFEARAGRVIRLTEETSFSAGSGLDQTRSDWVAAWSVGLADWLRFSNRFRIGDDLEIARNEASAMISGDRGAIRASYVFLAEDDTAGALDDRSEVSLAATLRLDPQWEVSGFMRRDIVEENFVETAAQVAYRTECAAFEFYAKRDFTDTQNAPAETTFGLRVRLYGAADGARRRSAVCGRP